MDIPKNYLHDRLVLLLITLISILTVIGVSVVMLRFDPSSNPTTVVAYRPATGHIEAGKPIDIYALAIYMIFIAAAAIFLAAKTYHVRRFVSLFLLSSTAFLLMLAIRVSWSVINQQ